MNSKELEERLIDFAVNVLKVAETLSGMGSNHLANQLLRSGTSSALNYGEAQGAESTKDFIHKLQVVLKELRETNVCLRIIAKAKLNQNDGQLVATLNESNELISIFVKTVNTAQKNQKSAIRN